MDSSALDEDFSLEDLHPNRLPNEDRLWPGWLWVRVIRLGSPDRYGGFEGPATEVWLLLQAEEAPLGALVRRAEAPTPETVRVHVVVRGRAREEDRASLDKFVAQVRTVSRERARLLHQLRSALEASSTTDALLLARQLVGLVDAPR